MKASTFFLLLHAVREGTKYKVSFFTQKTNSEKLIHWITTLILHGQNPPTVSSIHPSPFIYFSPPNQSLPFLHSQTSSRSFHPSLYSDTGEIPTSLDGQQSRRLHHTVTCSLTRCMSTSSPKIAHYQTFAGLGLLQCHLHSPPVSPPDSAPATAQASVNNKTRYGHNFYIKELLYQKAKPLPPPSISP